MKFEDRLQIFENLVREEREILLDTKGREYAGREQDADALSNFKEVGREIGGTKYQVLWIFLNKHLRSLRNAIKANPENPAALSEESLKSRIMDARNYLYLMYEMLQEDSNPLMTAHLGGYTRSYRFINETNAGAPPVKSSGAVYSYGAGPSVKLNPGEAVPSETEYRALVSRHEDPGGGCVCEGCRAKRADLVRDGLRPLRPFEDAARTYSEAMRQEQEIIRAAELRTFSTSEEILQQGKKTK